MEDSTKNARPAGSTSLPLIVLVVLVGLIGALLYIGYDSLADDTGNARELTNVPLDTTDQVFTGQTDDPENLLPDTTNAPPPVDLSQAPAPADSSVADNANSNRPAKKAEEDEGDDTPDPKEPERSSAKPKGPTSSYTVGDGETFYGVANRLNMKVATLKELNPGVSESALKSGVTKLNVRVKAVHTVGPGDVLRVVAARYGVSKEAIMRANHKTKDFAARGERLIIPLPEKQ